MYFAVDVIGGNTLVTRCCSVGLTNSLRTWL